jgi:hypothetical protein
MAAPPPAPAWYTCLALEPGARSARAEMLTALAGACEHRQVPLTILFRHLREDALAMLGGGTAAFMRLGHHAEAEQAASYIGRQPSSSSPSAPRPWAETSPSPAATPSTKKSSCSLNESAIARNRETASEFRCDSLSTPWRGL